jgi:Transposase DDE domain group 1
MATPQGLLPYTIEVVEDDATLTGHAGLPLVIETMRALGVSEVLDGALGIGGYDTKYLAVVSNRRELAAPALIRWHGEKAGTIERAHDVTKNDLAAAVPPCGRFGANAAWYRMSLLTYNILSAMKWLALPPSMETARPKRMRFALFSLAGRLVSHAGKLVLRIGREAEALASLITAPVRIAQVGLTRIAAATA